MSGLDVSTLTSEELPEESFPINPKAEFRLYLDPEVHAGISQHAKADTSVEICGVLVGHWRRDEHGPYAIVENYIRCESATSKFAEVTFTHESWAQINQEMDTHFEEKRIVGWYHSHPDFGIFLSERDCFIHEHFFSGAGQVAYVVDPVRDLEGVFAWKNNKPTPMSHYWLGGKICTVQASASNPAEEGRKQSSGEAATHGDAHPAHSAGEFMGFSLTGTLLAFLALFLMGYLMAGWRTSWERQAVIDGVVSNYTNFKQVKIGLREELAEVQKFLRAAAKEIKMMPTTGEKLSAEQQEKLNNSKKLLANSLLGIQKKLQAISNRYGFSQEEIQSILQLKTRLDAQHRKLQEKQEAQAKETRALKQGKKDSSKPLTKPTEPKATAESSLEPPLPQGEGSEDGSQSESSQETSKK